MDILTTRITEGELIQEQYLIAEYVESYKEEQMRILDVNFYEQHNWSFIIDQERDYIGDAAEEHFQEVYDFLYGKTYKEIVRIDNIAQAIREHNLDENCQSIREYNLDEDHQGKYSLLYWRTIEEVLASS
jgi:hypothetical protein